MATTTSFKTLNVVFHGTFLFWEKPDSVEVLIPHVKMHAYYAGNWEYGKLEWLDPGTYHLTNVHHGDKPEFDRSHNILVHENPISPNTDPGLRRLILPRPKGNQTLQRLMLQKNNIKVPTVLEQAIKDGRIRIQVPQESLGLIHVLTYDVIKGKTPEVTNLASWKPAQSRFEECPDVANLHFFADPPGRINMASMTQKHPTEAFSALMKLMPPKIPDIEKLQFRYPANEIPLVEPDPVTDIPRGLRRIELVSLATSNLLNDNHMQSHGAMSMSQMHGTTRRSMAGNHMSVNPTDVGCHYPYNCSSGVACNC